MSIIFWELLLEVDEDQLDQQKEKDLQDERDAEEKAERDTK